MNAKEQYKQAWRTIRCCRPLRTSCSYGQGDYMEMKAYRSWLANDEMGQITFKQFIQCLEAAHNGLAYATRDYWFFIVDSDELQFSKEECARFARYFSEGFHMNWKQYHQIMGAGGCYINERLFEDDEVFPLKANKPSYERWIIGKKVCDFSAKWVISHYYAEEAARNAYIPSQADYDTEQSDLQAELEAQRYGY